MNVIYKTIPSHTEENVVLDRVLEIFFMIDMNKSIFSPENIILFNITEQIVEPVTYEYNRRILAVTPTQKLKPKNQYQLQLVGGEKGLKDITGRMMADTYEVEFFTKDIESIKPPLILSPTDVTVIRELATFRLEDNMDADYYDLQISESNTFQNLVWPVNGEKVYRTTDTIVTPDVAYSNGLYYARVRSIGKGETSSWSDIMRFFYDSVPIIELPQEEPMPDEVVPEPVPTTEDPVVILQQSRKVVLQANSQRQEEDQLSKLQGVFTNKEVDASTNLRVKSATPKDKSVHNNVNTFNNMIVTGNHKQIIVEFTEDIDLASISKLTAYVLSERN
jgi:hypothetical protein